MECWPCCSPSTSCSRSTRTAHTAACRAHSGCTNIARRCSCHNNRCRTPRNHARPPGCDRCLPRSPPTAPCPADKRSATHRNSRTDNRQWRSDANTRNSSDPASCPASRHRLSQHPPSQHWPSLRPPPDSPQPEPHRAPQATTAAPPTPPETPPATRGSHAGKFASLLPAWYLPQWNPTISYASPTRYGVTRIVGVVPTFSTERSHAPLVASYTSRVVLPMNAENNSGFESRVT